MHARIGQLGEIVSRGMVAEKCGERRWKWMLENSRLQVSANEPMARVISFCQSMRVLMMNGPVCSNVHSPLAGDVFLLLRANQRKLWTSSENDGGRSRSA